MGSRIWAFFVLWKACRLPSFQGREDEHWYEDGDEGDDDEDVGKEYPNDALIL